MKDVNTPPGPKGKAVVGHLPDLKKNPLDFLTNCANTYGGIVYLSNMGLPTYLITDPQFVRNVLTSTTFAKPQHDLKKNRRLLGNGLIVNEGESWRTQRRFIQPFFHKKHVLGYFDIMLHYTKEMIGDYCKGEEINIYDDILDLTLKVVTKCLFNTNIDEETNTISQSLDTIMDYYYNANPLLEKLPLPNNLKYKKAIKKLDNIIYGIIQEKRTCHNHTNDLLSSLIHAKDGHRNYMNPTQIRDEVMTALIVGHDSTADAITWILYLINTHENIHSNVKTELNRVLKGKDVSLSDLSNLKYMEMVILEGLRLYPPAWIISRQAGTNIELDGFKIEKNDTVLLSPWVSQRKAAHFSNPNDFKPDRWESDMTQSKLKYIYFPFGEGQRKCIGKEFAMMEMKIMLTTILQRVEFDFLHKESIKPRPLMTLRPPKEYMDTIILKC